MSVELREIAKEFVGCETEIQKAEQEHNRLGNAIKNMYEKKSHIVKKLGESVGRSISERFINIDGIKIVHIRWDQDNGGVPRISVRLISVE